MNNIKIILADDHVLLRNSLALLIKAFGGFEVIGLAANGKEVIQLLENGIIPDVIVLDINMPVMDGYATAKFLQEKYPQINVLILTIYDSELVFLRLLRLGVKGFVQKDIKDAELENALLAVADSKFYCSGAELKIIISALNKKNGELSKKNVLNDTELEFLRFASTDMTYKEIADKMSITPRKVDHLRDNLFEKLQLKSRVALAVYAIQAGLVLL